MINTGLDKTRREFISNLERYNTLLAGSRAALDMRRQEALGRYHRTEQVPLDVRPRISGLTSYYSNDIDFRDIVHVVPRSTDTADAIALNQTSILPCDASRCAEIAREALERLGEAIDQSRVKLDTTLAEATAQYALRCDATSHAGYSFVLECPATVAIPANGAAVVPVTMTILSRDFDNLYPTFEISDENLAVAITGSDAKFQNLTDKYLAINAQTIYYNSQVQTRTKRIDLAPGVGTTLAIDEFVTPGIRIESTYRQMTPDKAERASFRFGFAARYRLAGAADEITLYKLDTFNVGCVISNGIRPGSCHDITPEAAPPAGTDETVRQDEPSGATSDR